MECPNCRELAFGKWVCSTSNAPSGDGSTLDGIDLRNLNISIAPLVSVWDSLEDAPQLQPSSDSSSGTLPVDTAPAEGGPKGPGVTTYTPIPPPNAPLLFSEETDDLHLETNVLEHYKELYPGLYRTVMTIQRVSTAVSNGEDRTDESIWAEPSPIPQIPDETAESFWAELFPPFEEGDADELTDEQIWAAPPPPSEEGNTDELTDEQISAAAPPSPPEEEGSSAPPKSPPK